MTTQVFNGSKYQTNICSIKESQTIIPLFNVSIFAGNIKHIIDGESNI